jgi:hypothetical protein
MNIIVQRVLSTQIQPSEKLQRHNLFQIFFVIKNRRARVIIDEGSCNNLVSSNLVMKLGLTTRPHPHQYHIQWLNDSGKAKITQICRVPFSIGVYSDFVDCDVVRMQACSFYWVVLGNMIMILHTMVEVINILLWIKDRKLP